MQLTLALTFDLAVASGTLYVMLAAAIAWWRREPYTHQDFADAMERICESVPKLFEVRDQAAFCGHKEPEALRVECHAILKDMLRNTCFIVNRAEPCCSGEFGRNTDEAEIHHCAGEVVRHGLRLILRLRWTLLWLAFRPGALKSFRRTLKAVEEYACLWSAVVRLLEARFPEYREQLSAAV